MEANNETQSHKTGKRHEVRVINKDKPSQQEKKHKDKSHKVKDKKSSEKITDREPKESTPTQTAQEAQTKEPTGPTQPQQEPQGTKEEVKEWGARDIKTLCQNHKLDISGCFEKCELIGMASVYIF